MPGTTSPSLPRLGVWFSRPCSTSGRAPDRGRFRFCDRDLFGRCTADNVDILVHVEFSNAPSLAAVHDEDGIPALEHIRDRLFGFFDIGRTVRVKAKFKIAVARVENVDS